MLLKVNKTKTNKQTKRQQGCGEKDKVLLIQNGYAGSTEFGSTQ